MDTFKDIFKSGYSALHGIPNVNHLQTYKATLNALIKNIDFIIYNNQKDVSKMQSQSHSNTYWKRISLNKADIYEICSYLTNTIKNLDNPIHFNNNILEQLSIKKSFTPVGSILIINNISPFINIILACLCFITGNSAILIDSEKFTNTNHSIVDILTSTTNKLDIHHNHIKLVACKDKTALSNIAHQKKHVNSIIFYKNSKELLIKPKIQSNINMFSVSETNNFVYIDSKLNSSIVNKLILHSKYKNFEILTNKKLYINNSIVNNSINFKNFCSINQIINYINKRIPHTLCIFCNNRKIISKFKNFANVKNLYINISNLFTQLSYQNIFPRIEYNFIPYHSLIKSKYIIENN